MFSSSVFSAENNGEIVPDEGSIVPPAADPTSTSGNPWDNAPIIANEAVTGIAAPQPSQSKIVTDPELIKELDAKAAQSKIVTDPELIKRLNAKAAAAASDPPENYFNLVNIAIDNMQLIQDAQDAQDAQDSNISNSIFQSLLKKSIYFSHALISARNLFSEFQTNDKNSQAAISELEISYLELQVMYDATSKQLEDILNDPNKILIDNGTRMKQIYELELRSKDAWESYVKIDSSAIPIALIDFDRTVNGKLSYLKITSNERSMLEKRLIKFLGKDIKNKNPSMIKLPAVVLYDFLSNEKWISADNKLN
jgi:hypothetical protein